jgi:uncharacterized BrkB/YihY/UPF0761 family membrane protein
MNLTKSYLYSILSFLILGPIIPFLPITFFSNSLNLWQFDFLDHAQNETLFTVVYFSAQVINILLQIYVLIFGYFRSPADSKSFWKSMLFGWVGFAIIISLFSLAFTLAFYFADVSYSG